MKNDKININEITKETAKPNEAGKYFFLATILSFILSAIYVMIMKAFKINVEDPGFYVLMGNYIATQSGFVITGLIYCLRRKISFKSFFKSGSKEDGKQTSGAGRQAEPKQLQAKNAYTHIHGYGLYLLCIVFIVGSVFLCSPFVNLIDFLLTKAGFTMASGFTISNIGELITGIIIVGLLPAFAEEIVFRGIILTENKKFGIRIAVLFSALLFMLMHGGIFQVVYQLFLGATLAITYGVTKDLKLSMCMHAANNITVLVASYVSGPAEVITSYNAGEICLAVGLFVLALILIGVFVWLLKKLTKPKTKVHIAEIKEFYPEKKTDDKKKTKLKIRFDEYMMLLFAAVVSIIIWIVNTISMH